MSANSSDLFQWLVDIRRRLHMHPEISHQETETTQTIVAILKDLGVEATPMADMTGAVGLIRGAEDGPTIGLRADIDALPIQELNDVPYRSKNPGVMHACGHDANATIMLGVARRLVNAALPGKMKGNVKFIFQPAEERGAGAKAMIARGVLENPRVDRIFAGHMAPTLAAGQVGIFRGLGYASADRFVLTITGKGAHSAYPEEGRDPVVAGAHFVTGAQSIVARNVKPTDAAVITVGVFKAGDASNVIPETARLEGSIRTLNNEARSLVITRLKSIAASLEQMFGVTSDFDLQEGVPVLTNDIDAADALYAASEKVLGPDNVSYLPPIMGSEDFSYFTQERPAAIMRLGCTNEAKNLTSPLHSPYFDIDEAVLDIGSHIFFEAVCTALGV
jgi:amidohydrolase